MSGKRQFADGLADVQVTEGGLVGVAAEFGLLAHAFGTSAARLAE